ncbi:hypothetical protein ACTRXD_10795 [Nitrospira sp. T9]|uniref:hypothetical protein n=1 Tax=unclassified Nitrospira TaxID=2652172 RepID=UPI003F9B80DD
MTGFAERTGLIPPARLPRRYLWTDAFAVCNYLELFRRTGEEYYQEDAIRLVSQVHCVLGRHREDDSRQGWISGLDEQEGELHPTRGGLRIGKALAERGSDEPYDEHLEWERDGQYFHYLTKWMHALDCLARVTGDSVYNQWAVELARTAHARFTYNPWGGGPKRMYWKMSIDLSYPLVAPMGQHDPLDGLITYQQLQATAVKLSDLHAKSPLGQEITEMTAMCEGLTWTTNDPLGIGGLLSDAFRLTQLIISSNLRESERLASLLRDAEVGLEAFVQSRPLNASADYRLAFRELGLSIGLHAIVKMQKAIEQHPEKFSDQHDFHVRLSGLARYLPLIEYIENFWLEPNNQQSHTWTGHRDINSVMLATSLAPDGYLVLH